MKLLVKSYLRNHTFQQLEDEHGVNARWNALEDKVSLNYDQITAKSGDPIAEQCRGLVVRPTKFPKVVYDANWKNVVVGDIEVLAFPMCRFYNYGDSHAAAIDWSHSSLKVYEKVDGTCIIAYWDPLHNKWHYATRSVPEADLPIYAGHLEIGDTTFAQLFLRALKETHEELSGETIDCDDPDDLVEIIPFNKELTYVFELVSPYNQIVVNYPAPRVYLLAARDIKTGREVPIESLQLNHVRRPKTWEIRDAATLSCFVDSASPAELEGAVACVQVGDSFQRLKVKNKTYVLAHRAKDSVMSSQRNVLETVIREKVDDVVPLVPKEVQDKLLNVQRVYRDFCSDIDHSFRIYRDETAGTRKDFALRVQGSGRWQPPYFNMLDRRASSCHEWIKGQCEKGKLADSALDAILQRLPL